MAEYLKRTFALVHLDRLVYNINLIRKQLPRGCKLMGVVKADAYGHGDEYVANEMVSCFVDWLGVSNIEEALSLRSKGIELPILIFGTTPPEFANTLSRYHITQAVFSPDYARRLSEHCREQRVMVDVHIKVDTGMGRIGFAALHRDVTEEIAQAVSLPGLHATGIFTHFSVADEVEEKQIAYTKAQFACFMQVIEALEKRGIRFALRHCCNSAATICYPEMHLDMVRPGIAVYGLSPNQPLDGRLPLKPVMELKSVIAHVKEVEEGDSISYGRTYQAPGKRRIATVCVGYADGYHRCLSNRSRVLVRGQFAPVVGRVCMDQMMVDVTGIDGVKEGDIVTLFGEDGGNFLPVEEIAELSGTVNYELVCVVGRRVPRIYLWGKEEIGNVDYIRTPV